MKKVFACVCGGAALAVLLTGCDPRLAQIESGSQEELWYKQLKENYPSFTPPPNPAPAAYAPNTRQGNAGNAGIPADDPEKTVDRAAEGATVKNAAAAEELPQAGAEDKKTAKEQQEGGKTAAAEPQAAGNAETSAADAQKSQPEGKLYIVKAGDTLGGIAKKFYGKASLDDVIFRANSKVLKNRNTLSIGMHLVIPEL